MLFSSWKLPNFDAQKSKKIQAEYGVSPMIADILANRMLTDMEIDAILSDDGYIADPFLLPDMKKAVERINSAIENNEKIAIYGDYDCDGITATVILFLFLQSMGADVFYYIPERQDEGYGLNINALDKIINDGAKLLITVDNGISAIDEIDYANSKNLDVIVTDHHQIGEKLPSAVAVINPHREEYKGFKDLCGAGVALKLCAGIDGDYESVYENFAVLASVGTIGDVMPLVSENRLIVKRGLENFIYTENIGLQALISVCGLDVKTVDAQKIAFTVVPRINAAGRMGTAKSAVELLLCDDESRAFELAEMIDKLNYDRRLEEDDILERLNAKIQNNPNILFDRVLLVADERLHQGVVGIVASRLVNLYGKPSFVLSSEGEVSVGSARSIGDFSLYKALCDCADLLTKYGGHKSAAGMTVPTKDIEELRRRLNLYAFNNFDMMPVMTKIVDKQLHISDINVETVGELKVLEPCGEENPKPIFLLKNCIIEDIIPLSENRHIKIKVNFEGKSIYLLYFKMSTDSFIYSVGNKVDILANLELNEYKNTISIAVKLCDIRPCDFDDKKILNALHFYGKIRRGEDVDKRILDISVPTVDELRITYKILRQLDGKKIHLDNIYLLAFSGKINYCKFRLMIDILSELSLVSIAQDLSSISLLKADKVDLESSQILRRLRGE